MLLMAFFYILSVSFFYYLHWPSLNCYKFNNATFCGVGKFKVELIDKNVDNGYFVFGYDPSTKEFLYEKIRNN